MQDTEDLSELVQDDDVPFDLDDIVTTEVTNDNATAIQATNNAVTVGDNIYLNKEKFSAFLNVLQVLKIPCQDLDVQGGSVCQMNNKKSAIYCIDMSSLLGTNTFQLSGIAQKYDLLDPFRKNNVDVMLDLDDTNYVFRDNTSKISCRNPSSEFLSNRFTNQADLNNRLSLTTNKVFDVSLEKTLMGRLDTYAKVLTATTLKIKFEGNRANFCMSPADSGNTTEVTLMSLVDELEEELIGTMAIPIDPFTSCLSGGINELNISMFHRTRDREFCIKLEGKLDINGSDATVPFTIWILAKLVQQD